MYYPLQCARDSDQSKVPVAYPGKRYHVTKFTRDLVCVGPCIIVITEE